MPDDFSPVTPKESARKGIEYYQMLQCDDGHWSGDYGEKETLRIIPVQYSRFRIICYAMWFRKEEREKILYIRAYRSSDSTIFSNIVICRWSHVSHARAYHCVSCNGIEV